MFLFILIMFLLDNVLISRQKKLVLFEAWKGSTKGHFTVVYLVAKPLIWNEVEGDLVGIETSI